MVFAVFLEASSEGTASFGGVTPQLAVKIFRVSKRARVHEAWMREFIIFSNRSKQIMKTRVDTVAVSWSTYHFKVLSVKAKQNHIPNRIESPRFP
jgi:hypothetical protein